MYIGGEFDVVVIGAGHAGCEAALASARMGCKTLICTINLDSIALMPCNPNIGGTAKGHLVREIDALGGEMGINTDKTFIQSRMLNTSKGPAVHSLRVQADKRQYCESMKHTIENQDGLTLRQLEVIDIEVKDGEVRGILTRNGAFFKTKTIVLTTGTYLNSSVIIGDIQFDEGPSGLSSSKFLTKSLEHIGLSIRRFKTGTPCRINRRSVDFSKMIIQEGDKEIIPFSFLNDSLSKDQVPCYLTYTNEETHNVIRENIDRSPLYNGSIKSTGPRYCPSIEDKVMRFQDKLQHQVFIEPEGINTEEMYVQGMSSSLPEDVQIEMLRTIPGLQNVEITRTGYAIEYDCIDPTELKLSLETKSIRGLFCGGQINGSSGYEEAGGQGLIAGINAARFVQDKPPVILNRSDAYIGVLIDDLVTKGTNEPYRMMTSRSEYRLVLRQDNADLRLTEIGHEIGLVNEERYNKFVTRKTAIYNEIDRIKTLQITGKSEVENWLLLKGSTSLKKPTSLYELIKRPELDYFIVKDLDINRPELPIDIMVQVNIMSKYEGYIVKQLEQINQFKKFEKKKLPEDFDYNNVRGLRIEAIQKLNKLKPDNIGQASRISGVSPADISVLMIFLEQFKSKNNY